ncbi:MAG: DUF4360 domain-containing protein [Bdellovibrionales bacterium]
MRPSTKLFCLTLCLIFALPSWGRDREKRFKRGKRAERGNEHSERPGRVPVGRLTHGGNGCPDGSMQVVFAPDNLSFSILFDQFVAEAQGGKGDRRDVMTCNAIIPIELPDGMQMEITRVDYRGFVGLPDVSSRARLHSIFNFRGRGGDGDRMNLKFDFEGPVLDNYEISSDLIEAGNTEISPCGGTTNLRVYNQVQVVSRKPDSPASVTIDSIDGAANALYYVNWRRCSSGGPGKGGGRDGRRGRG